VINAALFAAYNGDFNRAYGLVLMTQCHNGGAQQALMSAGLRPVLSYLLSNYQASGIDPNVVIGAVQRALEILAAS